MSSPSHQLDGMFASLNTSTLPAFAQGAIGNLRAFSVSIVSSIENEIEQFKSGDIDYKEVAIKVAKIAAVTIVFCCCPLATLAGAATGLFLKGQIKEIANEFDKQPVTVKAACVAGVAIAALISPQIFCGAAIAVAVSGAFSRPPSLLERVADLIPTALIP